MSSKTLDLVLNTITEILQENCKPLVTLKPETRILSETPLDSLDLAIVVVKLEEKTGKDPFKNGFIPFATIEELAHLYDK